MSVFDLFRRFFEPPGMRDPFFGGMTQEEEDEDEEDEDFFQGPPGHGFQSPSWGGRPPFHDPFGFEEIFRDFNELFADFGSVIRDVPRFPGIEPPTPSPEGSRGGSLRDSMLKYPDSHLPREPRSSSQDPPAEEGPPQADRAPQGRRGWTVTVTRGDEVISSGSLDTPRDSIIDSPNSMQPHQPSLSDLTDTQTILSRILHRWFSNR
ncbi:PREDICTED: HCLS1-associated protein X-1 [Nanorana parkeri]|uniref:HCLS1-associated protein X-1 n=1 Tax=Nanorana parkeri TaxID=125878 RepID=UPI000854800E|nr:PREDICTED: HCLS1-associated protein X-1 [Nanorana parkeri]